MREGRDTGDTEPWPLVLGLQSQDFIPGVKDWTNKSPNGHSHMLGEMGLSTSSHQLPHSVLLPQGSKIFRQNYMGFGIKPSHQAIMKLVYDPCYMGMVSGCNSCDSVFYVRQMKRLFKCNP